jgi:4-hydroxybenzoate polyprenyltransferase
MHGGMHLLTPVPLRSPRVCFSHPTAQPVIVLKVLTFAPGQTTISTRSEISFAINALIIVSTIYAQDFRDEIGDKRMGRRTIPILWPEGSRIGIFMVLIAWSLGLSWACELGSFFAVPFCVLAMFVGSRFLWKRTAEADQRSYRYYNIWLAAAQVVHVPVIAATLSQI